MAAMFQALVFKVTQLDKTGSNVFPWLVIKTTWYDLKYRFLWSTEVSFGKYLVNNLRARFGRDSKKLSLVEQGKMYKNKFNTRLTDLRKIQVKSCWSSNKEHITLSQRNQGKLYRKENIWKLHLVGWEKPSPAEMQKETAMRKECAQK